eukprot:976834-Amphidinium_carterae.1
MEKYTKPFCRGIFFPGTVTCPVPLIGGSPATAPAPPGSGVCLVWVLPTALKSVGPVNLALAMSLSAYIVCMRIAGTA